MTGAHWGGEMGDAAERRALLGMLDRIAGQAAPTGHIIAFANEKGGVGKSTLAFHCAVALAQARTGVLAIDGDARQQSLAGALESRRATATCLKAPLRLPRPLVVAPGIAPQQLLGEIARCAGDARFILVDLPGHDSPLARMVLALADTVVTPVNPSFVDLAQLARFAPGTQSPCGPGPFGRLMLSVQAARAQAGRALADWLMVKNRVRQTEARQQARVDSALGAAAEALGARVGAGLSERVGYRELYLFGLTHADLPLIPGLGQRSTADPGEVARLLAELRLPPVMVGRDRQLPTKALVQARMRDDYLRSIAAVVGDRPRAASTSA